MSNPYWQSSFFQFFYTFSKRAFSGFPGGLFPDELQLFVLVLLSVSAAIIGTFLVVRKMAMLANALSHTILLGIVVAYFLHYWLYQTGERFDFHSIFPSEFFLLAAGVITALLTTFLTESGVHLFGLKEDASCGVVFTFLFSMGVLLVTLLSKNAHVGSELLMGNADVLRPEDLRLSFYILIFNLATVLLLWRPLFVTSFDSNFAHLLGYSVPRYGYIVMTLTAISAIAAFRAVGVLLFLAFLVAPPLTARLICCSFRKIIMLSVVIGALASSIGVAFSRHLLSVYSIACSTGALCVTILFFFYLLFIIGHFLLERRYKSMA